MRRVIPSVMREGSPGIKAKRGGFRPFLTFTERFQVGNNSAILRAETRKEIDVNYGKDYKKCFKYFVKN